MIAATAATVVLSLTSTSYCDNGLMADGSFTRPRSVAMNTLPFGSKINLVSPRSFYGLRYFVVRDRYGWGTQLDFWTSSCGRASAWGRRQVKVHVVRRGR